MSSFGQYHLKRAKSAHSQYKVHRFFFWFNVVFAGLNAVGGFVVFAAGGPALNLIVAVVCVFGAFSSRASMRDAKRSAELHEAAAKL